MTMWSNWVDGRELFISFDEGSTPMYHKVMIMMGLLMIGFPQGIRADVVTDWNTVLLNAIKTDKTSTQQASRRLAMMHTAMFDSVNAVDHLYQPYHVNQDAPSGTSREAAAAQAAYRILSTFYPSQQDALDAALATSLSGVPDGNGKTNGIALGQAVADEIIAWRSTDHSSEMVMYTPVNAPGHWQPTPPNNAPAMAPQWPYVTPFAMTSGSQFRQAGPPALTSAEYAAAFNETKELGSLNSPTRTDEQTVIGKFWADGPGMSTPIWHLNNIAQDISRQAGKTLIENARLFAMLNIALADGVIAAWDMKYHYDFWRPVTAIRGADTDGNPDTTADSTWVPLTMTPAFQENVSTHSVLFAAGETVLASFFGSDDFSFTRTSELYPDLSPRSFTTFSSAAKEAGRSRIYAGLHFEFSNQQGQAAGQEIGKYVYDNFLIPQNTEPTANGLCSQLGIPLIMMIFMGMVGLIRLKS
jgi:hypothetical protein